MLVRIDKTQSEVVCSDSVVNVLDFDFVVTEFELQSHYDVPFRINTHTKKVSTSLYPQQWVEYYHLCSSTRLALALNKHQRLICQNQTWTQSQ